MFFHKDRILIYIVNNIYRVISLLPFLVDLSFRFLILPTAILKVAKMANFRCIIFIIFTYYIYLGISDAGGTSIFGDFFFQKTSNPKTHLGCCERNTICHLGDFIFCLYIVSGYQKISYLSHHTICIII